VSAIPIYFIAKDAIGGAAAAVIVIAYYASENILNQALGAFYPIQFIAPMLGFAFLFFHRERFRPFVLFLIFSLSVREEIALSVSLFGVYAAILRRRWFWIVTPVVLSVASWVVSTKLVMTGSQIAMEDLDGFFQAFGGSYDAILANVVNAPERFIGLISTRAHVEYVYRLLKPSAGLCLMSLSSMFMAPTVVMNSVVGGFWPSTLDITMHYSLVASVSGFVAVVYGVARLAKFCGRFRVRKEVLCIGLSFVLIPIAVMNLKDTVGLGVQGEAGLADDLFPKPYQRTIETIMRLVGDEADAAIAAPSIMLPQLSERERLYNTNRLWRYDNPTLDYIVLNIRDEESSASDGNRNRYKSMAAQVRHSGYLKLVFSADGFELYKAMTTPAARLRGIIHDQR
jgi:uncharacterized membrane protein